MIKSCRTFRMAAWSEMMLKNKGFPYSAVALLLLAVAATNAKRAGGVSGNSEQLLRGAADYGFPPEYAMPAISSS